MRFLIALYHRVLYVAAYLLVFFAVIFTLTRSLSPLLDTQRDAIVALATKALGTEVTIEHVAADWRGIQPEIWLRNVTINQPGTHKPLIQLEGLSVSLNLVKSLMNRAWTPSLIVLSGSNISIQEFSDGHFVVNGMTISSGAATGNPSVNLATIDGMLSRQPHVYLEKINVEWLAPHKAPLRMALDHLAFDGVSPNHYLINSSFTLSGSTKGAWQIIANIHGRLEDIPHLRVAAYVHANRADLNTLLPTNWEFFGYHVMQGLANVGIWVEWSHQRLNSLKMTTQLYDLTLQSQKTKQEIVYRSFQGNFYWTPLSPGFQLAADHVQIISANHVWLTQKLLLVYQPTGTSTLYLPYLNSEDLMQLLQGSSILPAQASELLSEISPKGDVTELYASATGKPTEWQQNFHIQTQLQNFSNQPWKAIPGISNFNATLAVSNQGGNLTLTTQDAEIYAAQIFHHPFIHNILALNLNWQMLPKGQVTILPSTLSVKNPDVNLQSKFTLNLVPKHPVINLTAQYTFSSPAIVRNYLPEALLPEKTLLWLSEAFISGDALPGQLILKGDLSQFPFTHQNGIFTVDTTISNLVFHFSNEWPNITDMKGDLLFTGHSMQVTVTHGQWMTMPLDAVTARIPNLNGHSHMELDIHANTQHTIEDMLGLVNQTPLKNTLGAVLHPLKLSGMAALDLNLVIPIHDTNLTTASGSVTLLNDDLELPFLGLTAHELKGAINFKNEVVKSTGISLNFLGQPAQVTMNTEASKSTLVTTLALDSHLDVATLPSFMPVSKEWLSDVSGGVNYHIDLIFPHENQAKNDIIFSSSLQGLAIRLPVPFGKTADELRPTKATVTFQEEQPIIISISHGNVLGAVISLREMVDHWALFNAHLTLGHETSTLLTTPGLWVDGDLDTFRWSDWQPYFKTAKASTSQNSQFLTFFKSLQVKMQHFMYGTLDVHPLTIGLTYPNNTWNISLLCPWVEGTVILPRDRDDNLKIHLSYLNLPKLSGLTSEEQKEDLPAPISLMKIPKTDISIDSLNYQGATVGQLTVLLIPQLSENSIEVQNLVLASSAGKITANAIWKQVGDESYTQVSGQADMSNLNQLIQALQLHTSLSAQSAQAQFTLAWPSLPWAFRVKILTGDVTFTLGSGAITDLGAATNAKLNLGKLLTLLSIKNLFFGFGDLSKQGYTFDKMIGDVHFSNGIILVRRMSATGTVADVKLAGTINLIEQTLNLELGVVVNATSSLPVLATIVSGFNPLVGLATWAVDKVVHTAAKAGSKYQYQITGSFDHPDVKDLAPPSTPQAST